MNVVPQSVNPPASNSVAQPLGLAGRQAWQVNFVTPVPQAMPSERLAARAELVRHALSSNSY